MLKYVLVLALIGMCFCAEDEACPSGKTDDEMSAACKAEMDAMMEAAMAGDADIMTDATAMSELDSSKYGSGCTGA